MRLGGRPASSGFFLVFCLCGGAAGLLVVLCGRRQRPTVRVPLTAHARQFSTDGLGLLTAALLGLSGCFALLAAAVLGMT